MTRRPTHRCSARNRPARAKARTAASCALVCAVATLWLVGCEDPPGHSLQTRNDPVVYGLDDRREVFEHPSPQLRKLARDSVVTLIPLERLDLNDPARIRLRATSLAVSHGLCLEARFADQPAAGHCTGVLVDDDIVLTAGHCLGQVHTCENTRFVFNFHLTAPDAVGALTTADVFSCSEILVDGTTPDVALVRLDRPATPRFAPATFKQGDFALRDDEPLALISAPSGIPLKIDDGGQVLDAGAAERDSFVASVDAFGGSSGGPVFDAHGELVGLLVAGASDYVWTGECFVPAVYPQSGAGAGEQVVYAQRAAELLCATEADADACTTPPRSWCASCVDAATCPADWACAEGAVRHVTTCTPVCTTDLDCRLDHVCDPVAGRCVPQLDAACHGDELWERDACGTPTRLLERCTHGCLDDACLVPCPDACEPGATRCVNGMVQTCHAPPATAANGCPAWDVAQACADGEVCADEVGGCEPVDAWCTACSDEGLCPSGWTCVDSKACRRRCGSVADCRDDHVCNLESGTCQPRSVTRCTDNGSGVVVSDACGTTLEAHFCSPDAACLDGRCQHLARPTCIVGQVRCGGTRSVLRCTTIDAAGTTAWRTVDECASTHTCSDGRCTVERGSPNRPGEPLDGSIVLDGVLDLGDAHDTEPGALAAGGGGCTCTVAGPGGRRAWPLGAAWLVALLALRARTSRRRRRCRRTA